MDIVSATELMNRTYRGQRHIYDFTRKYYLLGRDRMIEALDAGDGARVLEIGCGTGRNLIAAARRYPVARLFGVDVSTEMLTSADFAVARAGLAARIRLAHGERHGPRSGCLVRDGAIRPHLHFLQPVDDCRLARRARACMVADGPRRPVMDHRFRGPGTAAGVRSDRCCGAGLRCFTWCRARSWKAHCATSSQEGTRNSRSSVPIVAMRNARRCGADQPDPPTTAGRNHPAPYLIWLQRAVDGRRDHRQARNARSKSSSLAKHIAARHSSEA